MPGRLKPAPLKPPRDLASRRPRKLWSGSTDGYRRGLKTRTALDHLGSSRDGCGRTRSRRHMETCVLAARAAGRECGRKNSRGSMSTAGVFGSSSQRLRWPVHDHDLLSLHGDLTGGGEIPQRSIVDRPARPRPAPNARRRGERVLRIDVPRAWEDQVDPPQGCRRVDPEACSRNSGQCVSATTPTRVVMRARRPRLTREASSGRTINGARLRMAAIPEYDSLACAKGPRRRRAGPTTPPK